MAKILVSTKKAKIENLSSFVISIALEVSFLFTHEINDPLMPHDEFLGGCLYIITKLSNRVFLLLIPNVRFPNMYGDLPVCVCLNVFDEGKAVMVIDYCD